MERINNNNTKDELIKNFSNEQMEIYNYYKSKFSYNEENLYPILKEDKELVFMEKSLKIFTKVLKYEIVLGLIIASIVFMFGGMSLNNTQIKYKSGANPIEMHIKYNPRI